MTLYGHGHPLLLSACPLLIIDVKRPLLPVSFAPRDMMFY